MTSLIQRYVLTTTHVYGDNRSYRSLMVNTTELYRKLADEGHAIFISVSALPDIRKTETVGYSTFGYDDIGSIKLTPVKLKNVFAPDRTVLVNIRLKREQTEQVFRFMGLN